MESLLAICEELSTFYDPWERAIDADCSYSFGVYLLDVEVLIFGEVLHVGLVETKFAGLFGFHRKAGGHEFRTRMSWGFFFNHSFEIINSSKNKVFISINQRSSRFDPRAKATVQRSGRTTSFWSGSPSLPDRDASLPSYFLCTGRPTAHSWTVSVFLGYSAAGSSFIEQSLLDGVQGVEEKQGQRGPDGFFGGD